MENEQRDLKFPEFKYVEFVSGNYKNRNTIIEISQVSQYLANTQKSSCWTSHFRFTDDFPKYVRDNRSVEKFAEACYSSYLWFDIDEKAVSDTPEARNVALTKALGKAKNLLNRLLHEYDLNTDYLRCYFSGSKGFHVGIPIEVFDLEPSHDFNLKCRYLASEIARDIGIDEALYDKTRLFRLPNTVNDISGLYKIELSYSEIMGCVDIRSVVGLAKTKRDYKADRLNPDEISGLLAHLLDGYQQGRELPPTERRAKGIGHDYAGILAGKLEGTSRTANLNILVGHWFSRGIPLDEAIVMGKAWDTSNALGLDADPKYKSQYPIGKIAGTIEDIFRRNAQKGRVSEDEPVKLELVRASELVASDMKKPAMIFDRILPRQGYSVIASFTKEGKTTLGSQIILSILSETDFLIFPFENPVNSILYLYWEMDLDDLNEMLKTQTNNWQGKKPDLSKLFLVDCHEVSLDTLEGIKLIEEKIDESKAELVVIDPLMLAVSGDISELRTVKAVNRILRQAGKGKTISWLMIHHYSKPGANKRESIHAAYGSSGWNNFCVSFMGLERYSEKRPPDYKKLSFKVRRGRLPADMCVFLNPISRLFEIVENPEDEIEAMPPERVAEVFQEQVSEKGIKEVGYTLLRTWVEMSLGITERHSARLIKKAVSQKIIFKKPGRFGKYYIDVTN